MAASDAARFNPHSAVPGAAGVEQISSHGVQLVQAVQNRPPVVALFRLNRTRQPVEERYDGVLNAGVRRAKLIGGVRQELVG